MRLASLRRLYHEKRAALTEEELADIRERGRLNMRKLRAQNPEKYRKTEAQKRRWMEKARLYAQEYRIKNAAEIRARQEALSEDDKAKWRAHRDAQTRGYRAKKALLQPKPKHIVPERNVKRNATRTQQRKKDELHNMKSLLQTRINRAGKAYKQALEANAADQAIIYEAKIRLAVAEVDRYEFNLENGIKIRHSASREFIQLAQEARDMSESAAYLHDNRHSEVDHSSSDPEDDFDIHMDLRDDGCVQSDCSANHFGDFADDSFDGDDDAIQQPDVEMSVM
ncbi:hypothetical protein ALT_8478 [Aspergillus lentulus]|uniref:Uncharacterized protein n=1 Tax=Aspergillus lentulus TaxID=293939 RepID=A0AAN4PQM3_ASPLE|nr:hypothetical protein ALT_8478 [Aspergillus lentulus]